jgi:D-3-phosphoglycerate dehydrogenase
MAFNVVQIIDNPESTLPDYEAMIKEAGIEVNFTKSNCVTEDEIIQAAAEADVIIGVPTFQPLSRKVIERLRRCRLIMGLGIGFDELDVAAATEHGILAANVPDYCQQEMSDHVMALLLACTRKIAKLNEFVKGGHWQQAADPDIQRGVWPRMVRLQDQTLGIVGLGRIAQTLVPKAKGFGMRVIAYDPYIEANRFAELGVESVEFDELLSQSDAISLHCGLTDETRGMFGQEQIAKMKPSAYLINTSRGGLIDQEALYGALLSGRLAGAGLDVTDPEPIKPDDPLLTLENVVLTPHSAHASIPALVALMKRPAEETVRVLTGGWPRGLINHDAKEGYARRWG